MGKRVGILTRGVTLSVIGAAAGLTGLGLLGASLAQEAAANDVSSAQTPSQEASAAANPADAGAVDESAPVPVETVVLGEPIEAAPLASDAFSIGGLKPGQGEFPANLWSGANVDQLAFLFERAPNRPVAPAMGALARRVLLSSGSAPEDATPALHEQKLIAAMNAGFVSEATTIAGLSATRYSQTLASSALYQGDAETACAIAERDNTGRRDRFWVKLRVLCYALAGERNAADLTYNVLAERQALSEADQAYLQAALAFASGVEPKEPVAPIESALHIAIASKISAPLSPEILHSASGGVLASLVAHENVDLATRIAATRAAIAMGAAPASQLRPLLEAAEFSVAELGGVRQAMQSKADDPLTDALAFQALSAMSAPEFARDRAVLVGSVISEAISFDAAFARALLYADDIKSFDGLLVDPDTASGFALSMMAVGDRAAAGQWLGMMLGDNGSIVDLSEAQADQFVSRLLLLSVLDPQGASTLAERAGVVLDRDDGLIGADFVQLAEGELANIVDAAFVASADDIRGQAGLIALAVAGPAMSGSAVEGVVFDRVLDVLDDPALKDRLEFELRWAAQYASLAHASLSGVSGSPQRTADGGIPTPSRKPRAR